MNRISTEEFQNADKLPVILILENIRSLHNIGAAFRTADAFRVEAIWLVGFTAQPPHREIQKTALGATESVNWKYFPTNEEAFGAAKSQGYKLIALEQAVKSTPLQNFSISPQQKTAIVLGNEVEGTSDLCINLADEVVEIPQFGTKHSLNVSVSCGIILWEVFKKYTDSGIKF
ncbi:MAG: RNA methyltransferase [Flavobacteriales bacterium]